MLITTAALAVALTGAGLAVAVNVVGAFLTDLPSVDELTGIGPQLFQTTTIQDRQGRPIGELLGQGRRKVLPPEQIPSVVRQAVIAAEDATFYENPGVEPRAILRAIWQNLRGGRVVSGASTITQQLVKNALLTPEETVERKLKEAVLAWQISQRFSKDEILGLYLNQNYFGSLAYGIAAASETFFGKEAAELTLAEAAMLVGLARSPSTDNPHVDPEAARRQQLRVLDAIERRAFVSSARVEEARRESLNVLPPQPSRSEAPHFLNLVTAELVERYGPDVASSGWQVTTTLQLDYQREAQAIAREQVEALADRDVSNAALVALRPRTGEILAMVGSVDFNDPAIDGQVNVTLAERQPGSAFKLFTYAAALRQGHTAASMLLDIPTTIPIPGQEAYTPRNFDREFRGPVSLREAVGSSLNVPAVRMQVLVGVEATVDLAHRMGIASLRDPAAIGPALALGSNEVRLLDLTAAYGVLANQGRQVAPASILCVRDAGGAVIEQLGENGCAVAAARGSDAVPIVPLGPQVVSPEEAFVMTSILSDADARIEGFGDVRANLELEGRPAAVKTGTTEDTRDALTVGFTPELAAGVWVGNSDGHAMDDVTGVRGAAPIWKRFMETALDGRPARAWIRPPDIVVQEVDALSGLLPSPFTPADAIREEVFLAATVPTQRDPIHQPFLIHTPTGLLATRDTPADQIEERVFVLLPREAEVWQREQPADSPFALPPDGFAAPVGPAPGDGSGVLITYPADREAVRSVLEIEGAAVGRSFSAFEVHYGGGLAPGRWIRVGSPAALPVESGKLAAIDTIQLDDGLYTLRLTVSSSDGREEVRFRRFEVDNTPPTARIAFPEAGAVVAAGVAELGVEVDDAGGIAEVEYRVDGAMVARAQRAPFAVRWTSAAGEHELVAIVSDRAGNRTETEPVGFRVR